MRDLSNVEIQHVSGAGFNEVLATAFLVSLGAAVISANSSPYYYDSYYSAPYYGYNNYGYGYGYGYDTVVVYDSYYPGYYGQEIWIY